MSEPRLDLDFERFDGTADGPLSPAGSLRRECMLADLTNDMRRIHSGRRLRRRTAAIVAPLAVIAVGALLWRSTSDTPDRTRGREIARESTPTAPSPPRSPVSSVAVSGAIVTLVRSDHAPLEHMRVRTQPPTSAQMLTDGELLLALAAIDRPAGLVRSGARAWLTRNVADL